MSGQLRTINKWTSRFYQSIVIRSEVIKNNILITCVINETAKLLTVIGKTTQFKMTGLPTTRRLSRPRACAVRHLSNLRYPRKLKNLFPFHCTKISKYQRYVVQNLRTVMKDGYTCICICIYILKDGLGWKIYVNYL